MLENRLIFRLFSDPWLKTKRANLEYALDKRHFLLKLSFSLEWLLCGHGLAGLVLG